MDLKPCTECVGKLGKNTCTHIGCCPLEDVPGTYHLKNSYTTSNRRSHSEYTI